MIFAKLNYRFCSNGKSNCVNRDRFAKTFQMKTIYIFLILKLCVQISSAQQWQLKLISNKPDRISALDTIQIQRGASYYISTGLTTQLPYKVENIVQDSVEFSKTWNMGYPMDDSLKKSFKIPYKSIRAISIPKAGKLHNKHHRELTRYTACFYRSDVPAPMKTVTLEPFINSDSLIETTPFKTVDGMENAARLNNRMKIINQSFLIDGRQVIDTNYTSSWIGVPTLSRLNKINGFSISYRNGTHSFKKDLTINGLSVTADPFFFPLFMLMAPQRLIESYPDFESNVGEKSTVIINGLYLSTTSILSEPTTMNGLSMSLLNGNLITNGLQVSPIINISQQFKGLQISGFRNTAITARGLQIGLWNTAANLKGVQIGIWNSNQKRSMPLINWNFKS